MNNAELRQSATTAQVFVLSDDEYNVHIRRANLGGVTCDITATFPRNELARAFVFSFGISEYTHTELRD